MTVKDLRKIIDTVEDDRIVILAKDGEGNGFSPLADHSTGAYDTESTWSGEVRLEPKDLTDEMRKKGYSDEDVSKTGQPCLCLWPTN